MTHPHAAPRRTALKAALLAAAAASGTSRALAQDDAPPEEPPFGPGGRVNVTYDETLSFNELYDNPPMLGRSEAWRQRVVEDPADYNSIVRVVNYSDVLPIYGAVRSEHVRWGYPHNDVWFDVGDGYVHSSWIVPVHETFNEPQDVPRTGFWGEITVPTSWQHNQPIMSSRRYYDLAYGALFRVLEREDDRYGRAWYRLYDDAKPSSRWWVQAEHVRRVPSTEFLPISPDVPPGEKRIEVDLDNQMLMCYESDRLVFSTRTATGAAFRDASGKIHDFFTPKGEHFVRYKRPSRHMTGGDSINDRYDLPGVPWCTFITWDGVAIHGTYWHNDYGHERSHGCINVTTDAARWVYRWVNPYTGHMKQAHVTTEEERENATRVIVF